MFECDLSAILNVIVIRRVPSIFELNNIEMAENREEILANFQVNIIYIINNHVSVMILCLSLKTFRLCVIQKQ